MAKLKYEFKALLLNDIFWKDRGLDGDNDFHGSSLKAVKYNLISEQLRTPFPDSFLACKIKLIILEVIICAIYNPPTRSEYRFSLEDFQELLKNIPRSKPVRICGDLYFPGINSKTNTILAKKRTQS